MVGAAGVCVPDVGGCRVGVRGKGKEENRRDGLAVHGKGWFFSVFQNMD